jgi:uncharacterized circularly permuted ATP-grasp superfamily protein/uncharacterized alpha-E superfamily protein
MAEAPSISTVAQGPLRFHPSPWPVFNEAFATADELRPSWQKLFTSLQKLGTDELSLRTDNASRTIREHGITYNVYGDPKGIDRPWEVDIIPFIISPQEWKTLEAGVIQRARLLNKLLADIYGPQKLLRNGFLPPSLVFSNPNFLRPAHGIPVPDSIYIHLHAFDLVRSPGGQWWVSEDRTQAPSGSGYALENRIVLSRILPDEFRANHVQRLASFFNSQRETLRRLAPKNRENPLIVLFTPGPHNETYFEHAYLARYLGFTLVEPGDLTVRDSCLLLKTLEGLQQVDVMVRRVEDNFCDPLELNPDSYLGVPGLLQAARSGNVAIANALGSGLGETPAFFGFLPGLCKQLLGEPIRLPSVGTWWCGHGEDQRHVIDNLDSLVIKSAFASHQQKTVVGGQLSKRDKERLISSIQKRPYDFVAQEQVALSYAPVLAQSQIDFRPVVLRVYVSAGKNGYTVMPGGLTRVAVAPTTPVLSMQGGGTTKDTWVLSNAPVRNISLLKAPWVHTAAHRVAAEIPSRVADNLFWLGRYTERLEDTVRLLRCLLRRISSESSADPGSETQLLSHLLKSMNLYPEGPKESLGFDEFKEHLLSLIFNIKTKGSLQHQMQGIRQIASSVRDRFSLDTWRILNQLQLDAKAKAGKLPMVTTMNLLNTLIVDLSAFSGMEMENMTRGHGWRFLDLGRRLERAGNLAGLVKTGFWDKNEVEVMLEPLLEVADSVMTYRRRYFAQVEPTAVLDLLLLDVTNPRSLGFQLRVLKEHLAQLPAEQNGKRPAGELERLKKIDEFLHKLDLRTFFTQQGLGKLRSKSNPLTTMQHELWGISEDITHRYFTHSVRQVNG